MKPLVPYLFFNGNCREAMTFYRDCLGGNLELMTYADGPKDNPCLKAATDKIMHGCLRDGAFSLMASDMLDDEPAQGNNVHLNIECESIAETQKLFKALGDGGEIKMPLADTFWGAHFGLLIDKFGMRWMLNCPLKT